MKPPATPEGYPLFAIGGGDVPTLLHEVEKAGELADREERAMRLYFLATGLAECDDPAGAVEARRVMQLAIDSGSDDAVVALAGMLIEGEGGERDFDSAFQLLDTAAQRGVRDAALLLGKLQLGWANPDAHTKGVTALVSAAAGGSAEASLWLGMAAMQGRGMTVSHEQAREYYRVAAEGGNADAQFEYAQLCRTGTGGPEDAAEARRWLQTAAESGHWRAAENLGALMMADQPRNLAEAVRWYKLAAGAGSAESAARLCDIYATTELSDDDLAMEWYVRAELLGFQWPK
jgi:TPR repeat protein